MGKNSYGDITKNVTEENYKLANLPSFGDQGRQNLFKLRVSSTSENEQKNKYDKTVKSLASQTKNLIGNVNMNTMSANNMNAGMNSMNANSMSANSLNVMNAAMSNMNAMGSTNSMNSMNAARNSMNAINNTMNVEMKSNNARNMNVGMNIRDTRNIIIGDKKMKKIEFIREEPEQKNYLKV